MFLASIGERIESVQLQSSDGNFGLLVIASALLISGLATLIVSAVLAYKNRERELS